MAEISQWRWKLRHSNPWAMWPTTKTPPANLSRQKQMSTRYPFQTMDRFQQTLQQVSFQELWIPIRDHEVLPCRKHTTPVHQEMHLLGQAVEITILPVQTISPTSRNLDLLNAIQRAQIPLITHTRLRLSCIFYEFPRSILWSQACHTLTKALHGVRQHPVQPRPNPKDHGVRHIGVAGIEQHLL